MLHLTYDHMKKYNWVVVWHIFMFTPIWGNDPIFAYIFQMGWDHQQVEIHHWKQENFQCWNFHQLLGGSLEFKQSQHSLARLPPKQKNRQGKSWLFPGKLPWCWKFYCYRRITSNRRHPRIQHDWSMSFEFDSSSLADHLRDPADRVQLRKVFF